MTLTSNDIIFVYSGGQNNSDPSKSIGGYVSNNALTGLSNNLFTNLKKEEYASQIVDYRCFYIANNSYTDSLFNAAVYMDSQSGSISNCQIGISKSTEIQLISLSTSAISGNFKLKYEGYTTSHIEWNNNILIFQNNIETALNNLDIFSGVVVGNVSENIYSISFLGNDDNRNYSLLEVIENNLSPSITISFSKRSEGQPINSVAPLLPTSATIPYGVEFSSTSSSSKLLIGDLGPGDMVPIWIKRTSQGETSADQSNGFLFRLSGNQSKEPTQLPSSLLSKPCFYYA
jgi:hypothetical protein